MFVILINNKFFILVKIQLFNAIYFRIVIIVQKVIITGGAGFIGYHLSKLLLDKGFEVEIFDNFSNYYSSKIKWLNASEMKNKGATITKGSILNKNELSNSFENADLLFHLAAQPGVRYSTINPSIALRINVEGTANVLSVAKDKKIKRIVVAGSSSVFGNKEYLPIDENHPKNPVSYYGVSKLAAEKISKVTSHLYENMEINIIRPFTVVGARQRPDMGLNIFTTKALNNEKITIYGNGEQTRDWTHIENMISAFYLAAIKENVIGEDFNVGSGFRTSVNDLLKLISKYTGKELKIEYVEFDKADVNDTLADISKAKNLLGYKPIKSLENAIQEFIDDYFLLKEKFT